MCLWTVSSTTKKEMVLIHETVPGSTTSNIINTYITSSLALNHFRQNLTKRDGTSFILKVCLKCSGTGIYIRLLTSMHLNLK